MMNESIDADFDGKTDWTDFYSDGERIRAEWDTSFDGHPDLIRYYDSGKLARVFDCLLAETVGAAVGSGLRRMSRACSPDSAGAVMMRRYLI